MKSSLERHWTKSVGGIRICGIVFVSTTGKSGSGFDELQKKLLEIAEYTCSAQSAPIPMYYNVRTDGRTDG